ncbi:MAG: hypothetical protein LBI88_05445 [Deltaproteobacteria bacterium]|jgi:phage repressor protein C with HTH and peptisase S24 domain|nr:hypothetical protein [Deltaproteobacteria bacterium]
MHTRQTQAWSLILEEIRRIADTKGRGGVSHAGKLLGVTRGTISRWLSGALQGKRMPYDKTVDIMRALGLDPAPFFDAQGQEYVQVPWMEAEASMGGGSTLISKRVVSHLSFRLDWILAKGNPKKMAIINAGGNSMEPTIPDDAIVLINEGKAHPPVNGKIYFVCHGEDLFLKRLKVCDERVVALISDNGNRENPVLPEDHFEILGQAVWFGKEL